MFAEELQGTYLHGFKSYPKWIQISFNIEFVVSLRIPFQTTSEPLNYIGLIFTNFGMVLALRCL